MSGATRRVTAVVVALAIVGVVMAVRLPRAAAPPTDGQARAAARAFLARYVRPDGRVVRLDQGADTVSEGQAYGLVIAQVAGDRGAFSRIWAWTRAHLRRSDGLLASHADARRLIDPTPAGDADLLAAWALLRARGARGDGLRLARAVLARETTQRASLDILAAGPWATGEPVTLNPSYWAIEPLRQLAEATGDARWAALARSALVLTRTLTVDGHLLPPDWARIDGISVRSTPAANRQVPDVRYGLEAQRLVVWLASACDAGARRLAAAMAPMLSRPGRAGAVGLAPSGGVLDARAHALGLVAAAAATAAAGRSRERDRLLNAAARRDAAHPSYYGAAWVALGRALLQTRLLGGCAPGVRG